MDPFKQTVLDRVVLSSPVPGRWTSNNNIHIFKNANLSSQISHRSLLLAELGKIKDIDSELFLYQVKLLRKH